MKKYNEILGMKQGAFYKDSRIHFDEKTADFDENTSPEELLPYTEAYAVLSNKIENVRYNSMTDEEYSFENRDSSVHDPMVLAQYILCYSKCLKIKKCDFYRKKTIKLCAFIVAGVVLFLGLVRGIFNIESVRALLYAGHTLLLKIFISILFAILVVLPSMKGLEYERDYNKSKKQRLVVNYGEIDSKNDEELLADIKIMEQMYLKRKNDQ